MQQFYRGGPKLFQLIGITARFIGILISSPGLDIIS
jgi:hypothetical protein